MSKTISYIIFIIFQLTGCNLESTYITLGDLKMLNPAVAPVDEGAWFKPQIGVRWHWQLQGYINPNLQVDIYDIDLFDSPVSLIQEIKASGGSVLCYFSAGSWESFREDKDRFAPEDYGKTLNGWPDERWLNIHSENVHNIMKARLNLAKEKGCDGVEPDNIDGYINDTGFKLTSLDQISYNRFIANEAHKRGLAVALKNSLNIVNDLVDYFDLAINEQCFQYSECHLLEPFIRQGKPVLNAEYSKHYLRNEEKKQQLCEKAKLMKFDTLVLPLHLNGEFSVNCSEL